MNKRGILVLAALPVLAAVVIAAVIGFSGTTVPDDAIAVVEDTPITQSEFDRWLAIAAAQQAQGQNPEGEDAEPKDTEVPKEGTPQYEAAKNEAIAFLVNTEWIEKEAERRDVTITDRQVERRLEERKKQAFTGGNADKQFDQFLKRSNMSREDALLQIRRDLLAEKVTEAVAPQPDSIDKAAEQYDVSDSDIEEFYETNKQSFSVPATRDVRLVVAKNEKEAEEAKKALEADSSDKSWEKVAKEFSTDEQSKDSGGLVTGYVEGQRAPEVDQAVFKAKKGEIGGPVEGQDGFVVFEVEKVTPEQTQKLTEVRDQILAQLVSQAREQQFQQFQQAFRDRWQNETRCADKYAVELCDNAPDSAVQQPPGAPAVTASRPAEPGQTAQASLGLPQGPIPAAVPQQGLPGGGQLPPGAVPQGGAPGGPPGGAPGGAPGGPPGAAPAPGQ